MRSFIASVCCLAVILAAWFVYIGYSDETLHGFMNDIEDTIIKQVEAENWSAAYDSFDDISDGWHKYKKTAGFFLDTQALNEADYTIARCKYYIKAQDVSNASGELACLKEQLAFLHKNERVNLENIF